MAHPSSLSFHVAAGMQGFKYERGFFVVLTAYADDEDESQWALALKKLQAYAASGQDDAEMDPNAFALPVVTNSDILRSADYPSVRMAFNTWVNEFPRYKADMPPNDDNEKNTTWPSGIRRDACILIDETSLASLLKAPEFERNKILNPDLEPWVTVIDAKDPATVRYGGGGPYLGFTRAYARVLGQLFEDLGSRPLSSLSPVRVFDGQIPLYDGSSKGKLVDPAGGVSARYQFPRGTPRGPENGQAMLKQIQRALGRLDGAGK